MRRILCAFALVSALAWPAWLSAQAQPSPSTASPPGASAATSPTPSDIASRLSALSTMLSTELDGSETDLAELKSSLEASRLALESCKASLDLAAAASRRDSLKAALWRGLALSTGAGLAGALADAGQARGAAIGAGIGALAGAVWAVVERRPISPRSTVSAPE